jgi:predicted metal-dependent HD superfamily phosphohydrolase
MLDFLREYYGDQSDPEVIIWATIYHDAIYVPGAPHSVNEVLSSHLAGYELQPILGGFRASLVATYIRATIDHEPEPDVILLDAETNDLSYFLDADLLRLGVPWEQFQKNNADIRREYRNVSENDFIEGSNRILQGFLNLDRIFKTDVAYEIYEDQARSNITRLLAERGLNGPNRISDPG